MALTGGCLCGAIRYICFGLRRLDAEQSSDPYEVILERHRRASTAVAGNRAIDE